MFLADQKLRRTKLPARDKRSLERGLRTPEETFRRPILETLVELGGSTPIGQVLEKISVKMKDILNEYDREPLSSDSSSVR